MVSGRFARYGDFEAPGLVRLNPDGTVDTSFRLVSGARIPEDILAVPFVDSLAADPAGNVYVAGLFSEFNGVAAPGLARLGADGLVDTAFHPSIRLVDYGGAVARLHLEDGQIFAAGTFVGGNEVFPRALWRVDLGRVPSIASFPAPDLLGSVGGSITLEVMAAGDGPFSYRWQRDEVDLPGASSDRLTLGPLALADSGKYTVEVSNAFGSTYSPTATLRVVPVFPAEAIGFTDDGAPHLRVPVIPDVWVVVEASNDLIAWDMIAISKTTTPVLDVTDQAGRGVDARFYRVKFFLP